MRSGLKSSIVLATGVVVALMATLAHAQSGSRTAPSRSAPQRYAPQAQGSNTRGQTTSGQTVALEGYCPVCIIDAKKWVRGNPQHAVNYDGKAYFFPGEEQKQMFLANPAKYVPAMGGDCTVCFAEMNQRVPGNIRHATFYKNRLFLFPGDDQKGMFSASPGKYDAIDLALDGLCAVCMVEMNERVEGKPAFTVIHNGMRYLFPSEKQRDMFVANPQKYAVRPETAKQASHQRARVVEQVVLVRGKSGCAACDHGVHPLGGSDELGLAINSDDGQIYVVENAHQLYPELYENRFSGVSVELAGTVLKREGNIVWVEPDSVRVLR